MEDNIKIDLGETGWPSGDWIYFAQNTRAYPKVSGLAAWSENCKWYSSLALGAVVSLFCEPV
jgi:hypothetical protein